MELKKVDFSVIDEFEKQIAGFFGSKYAVAVDSCTHGVELCLRYFNIDKIYVPKYTYLSIPFLSKKLNIELEWTDEKWMDYYCININSSENLIYDAAVLWKPGSYIKNSFMCVSFQFQKHLSLGRGGIILCDNLCDWLELKKMSYDGRLPNIPWREQNIKSIGYHYYMTPETATLGLKKLPEAKISKPKQWIYTDWPNLTQMDVFK